MRYSAILFFVGAIGVGPHLAGAPQAGLPADSNASVDVIVRYRRPPTDNHRFRARQRGGTLRADLPLIRGTLYSIPAGSLEALARDPDVESVSPDRVVKGALDYAIPT